MTPTARRWLVEKGYDPIFAVRPMAHLIQTAIKPQCRQRDLSWQTTTPFFILDCLFWIFRLKGGPMSKKIGLFVLATLILASVRLPAAQQLAKAHRIGLLCAVSCDGPWYEAFRQGLRELGYVEGRNITIESRFAAGKLDQLRDRVAELVRLKVDVIVADGTSAARAAQNATSMVPIVMAVSGAAVEIGLVTSLARPGGNITGLSILAADLAGKQLELLKDTIHRISRVAVFLNPDNPWHEPMLKEIEAASRSLGLQLQPLKVRGPDDFESAFSAMIRGRVDAFLVLGDTALDSYHAPIADLAAKNRLPSISLLKGYVEAGGLLTYGPSVPDMFRRAASYVDRILKGTKPADLPVEQPIKFELIVNLRTAKKIGLTIPSEVLMRADRVIR
jgi:putative tryptophan/tyrosine transport system substrate-binding protein